ncbi:uncharacterized protein LOC107684020 [Sinocyclocheilus anshuiensis]|uniref:uncharacterized protein LOC107684020 n=1 Tax=Sinocyclocheilus anshuiensis TaxID=1608454 RepID=UPI0007B9892D|nr:PREDICTED: uncharacterized protein LOC107684020 [Sinocyclocheilus anshuiensis]
MASLARHADVIVNMIDDHMTNENISAHLSQMGVQKCSARSVRRFCKEHNVKRRSHVDDSHLELAVASAINEVGPTFGRTFMTGYLSSKGIRAGEVRVGKALRLVHPPYHELRHTGVRNLNPVPYHAEYMGHKLHLDQNEKLVMFGVTHVVAIDGFSSQIVAHNTMPVKNNLTIYQKVYREAVTKNGMWDQIRVDHGRVLYVPVYPRAAVQTQIQYKQATICTDKIIKEPQS